MRVILLILLTAVSSFAQMRQVIPMTVPGSDIVIQNPHPSPSTVSIAFESAKRTVTIAGYTTARFPSREYGYVLVESSIPIAAWTTIDNVLFTGVQLTTQHRALTVSANTGVTIANPWSEKVRMTVWKYDATGGTLGYRNYTLPAGKTLVGFVQDIFGITDGVQIAILTERPIAVGAADCSPECVMLPIQAVGVEQSQ